MTINIPAQPPWSVIPHTHRFVLTMGVDIMSWIRLICAFPRLESLAIRGGLSSIREVHNLPSPTAFRPSPNLRTLELDCCIREVFLEWLLALPIHPTLRSVCFHQIWTRELNAVGKFITALEDSLECLSLSAPGPGGVLSFCIMWCISVDCKIRSTMVTRSKPPHASTFPSDRYRGDQKGSSMGGTPVISHILCTP
jgi:hypothetical protein